MSNCYLVQYGWSAYLGTFQASPGFHGVRDERVIVGTARGLEVGMILASSDAPIEGTIERSLTANDVQQMEQLRYRQRELCSQYERLIAEACLAVQLIDVECLYDEQSIVLLVIPFKQPAQAVLDRLLASIPEATTQRVFVLDLSATKTTSGSRQACGSSGCDQSKGSCGSCVPGASGCATGGCSRQSIRQPDELTDYFARLRQQMEQRLPLN